MYSILSLLKPHIENKKGVTLIELIIVMVIIGLLSILAVPDFTRTIRKSRAKDCMQRLASDIKRARTEVQAEGQRAMVVVTEDNPKDFNSDGDTEHYLVFLDANGGKDFDLGETTIAAILCSEDVEMESSSPENTNPLPACSNFTDGGCLEFTTLGTLSNSGATPGRIVMNYDNYDDNVVYKVRIKVVSITGHLITEWCEGTTTDCNNDANWKDF